MSALANCSLLESRTECRPKSFGPIYKCQYVKIMNFYMHLHLFLIEGQEQASVFKRLDQICISTSVSRLTATQLHRL